MRYIPSMRKGIPVSPGVVVGTAYCINDVFVRPERRQLHEHQVSSELVRYEAALDQVANELQALQKKVAKQVGQEEAAIFAVHESIVRDRAFKENVSRWIAEEHLTAPAALERLLTNTRRHWPKPTIRTSRNVSRMSGMSSSD